MIKIEANEVPKIRVGGTKGVFQTTTTTYNQSTVTYSSSTQTYGGADTISAIVDTKLKVEVNV